MSKIIKKCYLLSEFALKILCSLSTVFSASSLAATEQTAQYWPVLYPTVDSATFGKFMNAK